MRPPRRTGYWSLLDEVTPPISAAASALLADEGFEVLLGVGELAAWPDAVARFESELAARLAHDDDAASERLAITERVSVLATAWFPVGSPGNLLVAYGEAVNEFTARTGFRLHWVDDRDVFDHADPLLPSATFTVHQGVLLVRWQSNRAGVVDTCSVLAADGTLLHLDPPRLASLDLPDDLITDIAALAVRRLPLEHARASDRYQLEQRSARMGFEELPERLRG